MKKLIFILAIVIFSSPLFAQDHLKIKGVPIDGDITNVVTQLKAKGLKDHPLSYALDNPTLIGTFAEIDNCIFAIHTLKDGKSACAVKVITPDEEKWSSVKETYYSLKNQYTSKYGEGDSVEEFKQPYYDGRGFEFRAFNNDQAEFVSRFEVPDGVIVISIASSDGVKGNVSILYYDRINFNRFMQERQQAISDDI